ncbi:MAG: hypothetical protein OEV59_01150 [Deltaproteobacteria bacterium]|nr:hypothetical protein [Deltaproteobacteria bacterium]
MLVILLCSISLLCTFLVASVLPINSVIKAFRKSPDYFYYQAIHMVVLWCFWVWYGAKKEIVKLRFANLVLLGFGLGYAAGFLSNFLSPILYYSNGMERIASSLSLGIGSFFAVTVFYPFMSLGWVYGIVMGLIIYFLDGKFARARKVASPGMFL